VHPHLIRASLQPPESMSQTASRSVQPFFAGLTIVKDRHTIRPSYSVCNNRPHLRIRSTATRPNNNATKHRGLSPSRDIASNVIVGRFWTPRVSIPRTTDDRRHADVVGNCLVNKRACRRVGRYIYISSVCVHAPTNSRRVI